MKILAFLLSFLLLISGCKQVPEPSGEVTEINTDHALVLIPAGEFEMGREPAEDQKFIDNYAHNVYVDSFYIDKYEVTNAQYFEFCQDQGHALPEFWGMERFKSGPEFPNHPVTGITWADARAYAKWKGYRLPTEAEWEFAARGGLVQKKYPTGDSMDSTLANYYPIYGHPLPVGAFPPNGYGLYDMAGNVVEWVEDFYDKDYFLESPEENPTGPVYGKRRVIRGGGWRSGIGCNTVFFRQSLRPYWVDINVGFRCAKDVD